MNDLKRDDYVSPEELLGFVSITKWELSELRKKADAYDTRPAEAAPSAALAEAVFLLTQLKAAEIPLDEFEKRKDAFLTRAAITRAASLPTVPCERDAMLELQIWIDKTYSEAINGLRTTLSGSQASEKFRSIAQTLLELHEKISALKSADARGK